MTDPIRPEMVPPLEEVERQTSSFPVVGIGASAGGLAAFSLLLSHLPEQTGMAFVLVQHLDPIHESQLAALLASTTRLPVREVADGMVVEPNHIYIIPPAVTMTIKNGVLQLSARGEAQVPHLPVDLFFRSLAEERQSRAIGVILSGTGSDGARGLAEIKAAGGITFAQDDDSAEYASMPQSAVAGGCVDFVLPPDEIAGQLAQIGQHPYLQAPSPPTSQDEAAAEGDFAKILGRLRAASGVDFGEYRQTTLKRRIARRMALHKQESLPDYLRLLQSDPKEIEALYRDMLINVTSFFRDPEVFEALKTTVFPEIIKGKSPENPVRIWVPGCSTGQEAYSLAMVMLEFLDQKAQPPAIQIFGTDINDAAAVEKARPGIYPPSIEAEVSPGRLQRFFTKVEGGYRIGKMIRDICVFARQDVAADPPFSRLDLISCRNLLIYLAPSLQQRIIPTFHYALKPGGFLLLGPSEAVGKFSDLFDPVDRAHNIYARTAVVAHPIPYRGGGSYPPPAKGAMPSERLTAWADMRKDADRMILDRFAPAAVLIDENLEILQFRGPTASYLAAPSGQATHNILKMARDSLFLELRSVIEEARKLNATARREQVQVREADATRLVNLEVAPIQRTGSAQRCFLVLFTEAPAPAAAAPTGAPALAPRAQDTPAEARDNAQLRRENAQLVQELASVKEYLQAIIEQQNAANEELQSANEEIRSANEELQTNNEEMQTAREELQSTNEELRTVNAELQVRNDETTRLGNDLSNTLYSIDLPIVIMGRDLRIRRFTAAAGTLLNMVSTDVGRPFADTKLPFDVPDLTSMLLEVTAKVAAKEQETQDSIGRWYSLAIYPYRTDDHRIDGVVLVLRDINQRKLAEEALRAATVAEQASLAKDHFLAVLSHELRTPLTPVLATVAMLQQTASVDADTREQLEVIRRNVDIEVRLIDDLLDVTRIVRGKVELEKRPVGLCTILQHAVDVCRVDIEAQKLEFALDIKQGPYMVDADAGRLQQVFWNLLRNAIKFTPQGGCVGVRCGADGQGQVMVEVSDSGVGIKPEVIGSLFKAFEQGGSHTTRRFGGLGLGLAICSGIVKMHGGSIEAHSDGEGKGATFRVRLPLLQGKETGGRGRDGEDGQAARSEASAPVNHLRILLVEDHNDTARIMKRLLVGDGHDVQVAGDVATALELSGSRPFDLLISDLGLPDGSGVDLMRQLRQRGWAVPGIALSGFGQEEDILRSKEAGFAAHLTKPTSPARLAETIALLTDAGTRIAGGGGGG